jgi:hypothetical protein
MPVGHARAMRVGRRPSLDDGQTGLYPFFGVYSPFDPDAKFATARFLSPFVFGILRLAIGAYSIIVVIVDIVLSGTFPSCLQRVNFAATRDHDIDSYFSYFTDISFIALAFYFLFAAGHTLWYARTGTSPLNKWYRPFQLAHTILFSTIITFSILVTIVFWSLLSNSSTFATSRSTWSNISKHALNSVYAIFEILFSAVGKQPWSHFIFIMAFLGMSHTLERNSI